MSKPLSDEKRQQIFENIIKSIAHLTQPAPGEFTVQMIWDALLEAGHETTKSKVFHRLANLVDAGILSKREISAHGARTNVYFPIKDVSYEDLIEALSE